MKKLIVAFIGLFFLFTLSACGPSFRQYVSQCSTYSNDVSASGYVTVNIEPNKVADSNGLGAFVNLATTIASIAISAEQRERLNRIIDPTTVAIAVSDGFEFGFHNETHLEPVDINAGPDLMLHIDVYKYGLWAHSLASPMEFFVEANISIIYTPENKRIYSNGVSYMRSASNVISEMANATHMHVYVNGHLSHTQYATIQAINDVSRLARGAANLSAFLEMTDEEIIMVMDYLAYHTGFGIAYRLVKHIYPYGKPQEVRARYGH